MVAASECAHALLYSPSSWSELFGSRPHVRIGFRVGFNQGTDSLGGCPEGVTEDPSSTLARCFTKPNRFVPVAVIGRRMSYSERPSSFHTSAARAARR